DPASPQTVVKSATSATGSTTFATGSAAVSSQRTAEASQRTASALPTAKISDFGLAKRRETTGGAGDAPTRTGAVIGTPAYMAPEQAFGHSKDVGPAADIYALGAVLYECLTGQPPFRGATLADLLDQVRTREPVPLRELARKVPRDLETICLHCLRKEPERRYVSAEALAEDLRRVIEGRPIPPLPLRSIYSLQ